MFRYSTKIWLFSQILIQELMFCSLWAPGTARNGSGALLPTSVSPVRRIRSLALNIFVIWCNYTSNYSPQLKLPGLCFTSPSSTNSRNKCGHKNISQRNLNTYFQNIWKEDLTRKRHFREERNFPEKQAGNHWNEWSDTANKIQEGAPWKP